MAWARMRRVQPSTSPTDAKRNTSPMPIATPGMTRGESARLWSSALPGKAKRATARAKQLPAKVDRAAAASATTRLTRHAWLKSAEDRNARYHSSVKPSGGKTTCGLKEIGTATAKGRKRKMKKARRAAQ